MVEYLYKNRLYIEDSLPIEQRMISKPLKFYANCCFAMYSCLLPLYCCSLSLVSLWSVLPSKTDGTNTIFVVTAACLLRADHLSLKGNILKRFVSCSFEYFKNCTLSTLLLWLKQSVLYLDYISVTVEYALIARVY